MPFLLFHFHPRSWPFSRVIQSDIIRSGQYEQKNVLLWRTIAWGTPMPIHGGTYHLSQWATINTLWKGRLEQEFYQPLPILVPGNGNQVTGGSSGGQEVRGKKKEKKRDGRGVCFVTHQNWPHRPKSQPSGKSFAPTLDLVYVHADRLRLSSFK